MKMKNKTLIPLATLAVLVAGCATRPPRHEVGRREVVMPPTDPRARQQAADPRVTVLDTDYHAMPDPVPSRPPPTFTEPAPAPVAPRIGEPYTIRRGETLSGVAARHRLTWRELADYNRIVDPNSIRAGQVILLPPSAELPYRPTRATPAPPVAAGDGEYVVRPGDNLSVIARRHGTTVAALRQVNNLTSDRILAGQKLKLPSGVEASRPRETTPGETPPSEPRPRPTPVPPVRPTPMPLESGLQLPGEVPDRVDPQPADPEPVAGRSFPIIVEEGDTLDSIANSYIMSVEALRRANNLPAGHQVQPGDRLMIPPSNW